MLAVDRTELERVLHYFNRITGFRIAVFDPQLSEVAACPAGLSEFCTGLRCNTRADDICRECDKRAFEKARNQTGLYLYMCEFGLYEAVFPILVGHAVIGYMMIGQMLADNAASRDLVLSRTKAYWKSPEDSAGLVGRLPLLDYKSIQASAHLMAICAAYLSLSGQIADRTISAEDQLTDFIRRNYTQDFGEKALYEKFGLSRTAYYDAIKARFGCPKNAYVNRLRVEEARRLLSMSDIPVKDIAGIVGFEDPNYFARVFRSLEGISPRQYREQSGSGTSATLG
ncbi:MAG: PocR ligand-binding domain-containing protein [Saccharofermentanales bacterium]